MAKAYDFSALVPVLKKAGLKALESFLDESYIGVKTWIKESAKVSDGKIDDLVASQLDGADAFVKSQIDKISP